MEQRKLYANNAQEVIQFGRDLGGTAMLAILSEGDRKCLFLSSRFVAFICSCKSRPRGHRTEGFDSPVSLCVYHDRCQHLFTSHSRPACLASIVSFIDIPIDMFLHFRIYLWSMPARGHHTFYRDLVGTCFLRRVRAFSNRKPLWPQGNSHQCSLGATDMDLRTFWNTSDS